MSISKIKSIKAREILDSRGNPTVEVDLKTNKGLFRASVPSGVSKGKYEAVELRDGGKRYQGKGVKTAVKSINEIIGPKLKGQKVTEQAKIDYLIKELDGTENKSLLGANTILAVSMAVCRAGAKAKGLYLWEWISKIAETKPMLPLPCVLCIEGGLHSGGELDTQEFMVVPRADSFQERLQIGTEIYHILGTILREKYGKSAINVGIEGGFTPAIRNTKEVLDQVLEVIKKSDYRYKLEIILDVAASSFFRDDKYYFEGRTLKDEELLEFYLGLCREYPIIAIEDPFAQADWEGFQQITQQIGKKVTIIGDDLLVTNIERMKTAKAKQACNGVIIKPNQIGTVTETINAAKYAAENGWQVFVKHRGGETLDSFISDLAVGLGMGWIMAGAPSRGERVAKYNRLLRIEEEI